MKKILLLGGSRQQIPAIVYAKEQGYYTILCDYLFDNPGQYHADKFFCVSTTDKESILRIATMENIDGIVAYASDPAAPTAAYVAEKLVLPTNQFKSVEILAYKDKFRKFLKNNGFNCPLAKSYDSLDEAKRDIKEFKFPIMIKPIDSSGSKGVSKIESPKDIESSLLEAFDNSRSKNIIIEEFIQKDHKYMIGGDFFVLNGKVKYWGLLNCHRNSKVNPLVPIGKSYPLFITEKRLEKVEKEIQKLVDLLKIDCGGFNLEIIIDNNECVYLIEVGPRNGGNMIPDFLKMIHGIDLIGATIETAVGNKKFKMQQESNSGFYATHNLHAEKDGLFNNIEYKNEIEEKIIKKVIYKKIGDSVQYFDNASKAIGIIFLKFNTQEEQINFIENPSKWIEVIIK